MSKYLVSVGDSDKYAVEFPGTLAEFEKSDKIKDLKDKIASFIKEKLPMANFKDIVPLHIEEADGKTGYEELDASKVAEILKSALKQVGVEKFTDKLNLNAPFDIL